MVCNNVSVDVDEYRRLATLEASVKSFFDDYLNKVEESDSGYLFHPVAVSCCRALKLKPLGELLDNMRKLSGASKDPLDGVYNE